MVCHMHVTFVSLDAFSRYAKKSFKMQKKTTVIKGLVHSDPASP